MTFVVKFSNDDERARAKKILEDAGGQISSPIQPPPYQQFVVMTPYPGQITYWATTENLYQNRPAVSIEDLPTYLKLISI